MWWEGKVFRRFNIDKVFPYKLRTVSVSLSHLLVVLELEMSIQQCEHTGRLQSKQICLCVTFRRIVMPKDAPQRLEEKRIEIKGKFNCKYTSQNARGNFQASPAVLRTVIGRSLLNPLNPFDQFADPLSLCQLQLLVALDDCQNGLLFCR